MEVSGDDHVNRVLRVPVLCGSSATPGAVAWDAEQAHQVLTQWVVVNQDNAGVFRNLCEARFGVGESGEAP